jgi:hypothetical protein
MILTVRQDKTLKTRDGRIVYKIKGKEFGELRNEFRQVKPLQDIAKQLYIQENGIPLTRRELQNAAGYEVAITTLTTIKQLVTSQSFYEIPVADHCPLTVGEGAFSTTLVRYRVSENSDDFDAGYLKHGANNTRLQSVNVMVDPISNKVHNWAKELSYDLIQVKTAAKAGNWDLIQKLESARKTNWDLGIQKKVFLGTPALGIVGMLNMPGVTINTGLITKPLKAMNATELNDFAKSIITVYRTNCNRTKMPNRFSIPEADYLGLGTFINPEFPLANSTKLEYLENIFKKITGKQDFKILYTAYHQKEYNAGILGGSTGLNRYCLYNYDPETFGMDMPINYTTTIQDTTNGFTWQSVAYGQHTGQALMRPLEVMYFDHSVSII